MIVTRAMLLVARNKFREFGRDCLDDDGCLRFVIGNGQAPADTSDVVSQFKHLPSENTRGESGFSSFKRLAPNSHAEWTRGPKLCYLDGILEGLFRTPAVAAAFIKQCQKVRPPARSGTRHPAIAAKFVVYLCRKALVPLLCW